MGELGDGRPLEHVVASRSPVDIRLARVYEDPAGTIGERLLVDRLWPRGIRKEPPRINDWLRDVAPSEDLRNWFGHEPGRWDGFVERYRAEFAASDRAHNRAVVLRQYRREQLACEAGK